MPVYQTKQLRLKLITFFSSSTMLCNIWFVNANFSIWVFPDVGLRVVTLSYPLKTSLEKGQWFRGIPCAVRAGFQVALTRLM